MEIVTADGILISAIRIFLANVILANKILSREVFNRQLCLVRTSGIPHQLTQFMRIRGSLE